MNTRLKMMSTALALGFLFFGAQAFAGDPDRIDKISNKDFSATVKAVDTALKKHGFMVVATIDHQNMLRMVGATLKGSATIEFGKPDMAKMLLPMLPEAGLEMPARFFVWQRGDGKIAVSYRKPSAGFRTYGNEMVAKMGNDMDVMWAAIVEEATK